MVKGTAMLWRMARSSRAVAVTSFMRAAPLPLRVILGMGQPMLRSTMSAPSSSQRRAAGTRACGSVPRSCMASGRAWGKYAAMSWERGVSIRRAKASISSVVVSPLPHSLAMRRNGALLMAAMGARRQSSRISTEPIFMVDPGSGPAHQLYTEGDDARRAVRLSNLHALAPPPSYLAFPHHQVAQHADVRDLHLDNVTVLHVFRRAVR